LAAALATLAAVLALTGPGLAHDYATGIAACTQAGGCSDFVPQFFDDHQGPFLAVSAVVLVLPALIGLFWGAPLITRELEAGTHRLVWNQSITPTRWLGVKLALTPRAAPPRLVWNQSPPRPRGLPLNLPLPGLAAMTAAGLGSLAVSWWAGPIDKAAYTFNFPKLSPLLCHPRAIVPIAYAAFAFVLGVTVGMLVRRPLAAMAITLAVFVAVQVAMPQLGGSHLIPPVVSTFDPTPSSLNMFSFGPDGLQVRATLPDDTGAWVLSSRTIDASGHTVTRIPSNSSLSPTSGPCAPPTEPSASAPAEEGPGE